MVQGQKDKYKAYSISAVLHLIIFVIICLTGLFTRVSPEVPHNIDVDIYEAVDLSDGGGGGGASPPSVDSSIDSGGEAVTFNVETKKLPEIAEEYTKEPEKQQQYRQEHQAENVSAKGSNGGMASLGGAGSGTGQGIGQGSGNGSGSGTGNGDGAGSGNGTGHGSGRDEGAAKVAKVPPRFLGGSNPVYPEDLQDQGIGGTVVLRLTVSADGTVTNVDIAGSSGISQLDKAAVKAAYTYSFAPARNVYDEPVMCIMNKKVVFVP